MTNDTFDRLAGLSTEELRERAFALARHRHDVRFFWDLFRRLPHGPGEGADGSLGIQSSVDEAVTLWRELTGHAYGEEEPLVRAAFIDYLLAGQADAQSK
ncbi:MAG TPA: hypothetical protein VJT31_03325 [Rugosimonospora sp.]|nr:hypothetical protein [Rugosimonospora sp.]